MTTKIATTERAERALAAAKHAELIDLAESAQLRLQLFAMERRRLDDELGQLGTAFVGIRDGLGVSYESLGDDAVRACAEDLEHMLVMLRYSA
jgi:hypothetical protein